MVPFDEEMEEALYRRRVVCPDCGEEVDPYDDECPACGARMTFGEFECSNCGEAVDPRDKECPKCGEILLPDPFVCPKCSKPVEADFQDGEAGEYQDKAEAGDLDAQFCLGKCLETGRGVTQDFKAALQWYEKAARKGHVDSQHALDAVMPAVPYCIDLIGGPRITTHPEYVKAFRPPGA